MKVLVTGGREYSDRAAVFGALDSMASQFSVSLVVTGGSTGADTLAGMWSEMRGVTLATFPALHTAHGDRAISRRNERMLAVLRPDVVLAFPGDEGTADLISKAERARILIVYGEDVYAPR